ncbi:TetR/AcrR family transcriptional regulator [Cellulomonas sp.]|uniref:TetR/AcrR family transcriptional regulator n=1 Tax=Cellulomonas sp. TaxID=40001 RepID=UPI001B1500CB|nr:TetR/AcrR family transcriptional regulator [Cellulomonas sp.]MBO9554587.1 TetR/AcrR family transcriptional regulator [Cellulomonas sp.]
MTTPLSGRRAQAARNDDLILEAARAVFMRTPDAPIAAVAQEAGVGVSALYRRYAGKEDLLATLCADGLRRFIQAADEAERIDDPAAQLDAFVRGVIAQDVHSLTVHLAGTFTPTPELGELAAEATARGDAIFHRAKAAGVVRDDLETTDLAMVFEQITAVRLDDPARTAVLRDRYLTLLLDALRPQAATGPLPGPAPTAAELGARWVPRP